MPSIKRFLAVLAIVLPTMLICRAIPAATPLVIPVWPQLNIPLNQRHPRKNQIGVLLAPVRWPELTCYPAAANNNSGTAVIICPGGGYVSEWVPPEGVAPAKWFNHIGMNCFILRSGTVKWPKECEHWLRKLHFLPAPKR